ncbi:MAG: hypothetical protein DMF06_05170 [Verrucomicrobia bacterium]|nr:MAG: hypothetical protein DMF06_05170 [Verrucomicrobiota bacterium]
MTTATAFTVLHDFPAYDVVEPIASAFRGMPVLTAGDELALADSPMQHYKISSVASYALQNNDCPIEAVERAKANGHDLHFVFALGTVLTSHKRAKGRYIGIECGREYWFEGKVIRFEPAPNRNLKLVIVR